MEKWLYASKTMKINQIKCDECGKIEEANKGWAAPGVPHRMISVELMSNLCDAPGIPSAMTATGLRSLTKDFCSERCLAEFMAKRVSSDSSTNVNVEATRGLKNERE